MGRKFPRLNFGMFADIISNQIIRADPTSLPLLCHDVQRHQVEISTIINLEGAPAHRLMAKWKQSPKIRAEGLSGLSKTSNIRIGYSLAVGSKKSSSLGVRVSPVQKNWSGPKRSWSEAKGPHHDIQGKKIYARETVFDE